MTVPDQLPHRETGHAIPAPAILAPPTLDLLQQVADGLRALDEPCCTGPCELAADHEISIARCTNTEPHPPHPGSADYTTCPGVPEPAHSLNILTERRTVSVEVITPELRARENVRRYLGADESPVQGKPVLVPDHARVAVVVRAGRSVSLPELDTDWASPHRQAPDILAQLLRQARFYADIECDELLMPGPDVLAALTGQPTPDVTHWTLPLHIAACDIEPGWQLLGNLDGVSTAEVVLARRTCRQPACPTGRDCIVLVVPDARPFLPTAGYVPAEPDAGEAQGQAVHWAPWSRPLVRIPATKAAAR